MKRDISDRISAIRRREKKRLKSSRLKVKELGKSTDDAVRGSEHTPAQRKLKFAEERKRDDNTEFTEGRTQRSQRKAREELVEELRVESRQAIVEGEEAEKGLPQREQRGRRGNGDDDIQFFTAEDTEERKRRAEERKTEGGAGQDHVRLPGSLHCAAAEAAAAPVGMTVRASGNKRGTAVGMTGLGMGGMVWNGHASKAASRRKEGRHPVTG